MATIVEVFENDFNVIREIAHRTWPTTYGKILSKAQMDYMLENFFSDATLNDNITNKKHHFLLLKESNFCLGFASYEHHYLNTNCTRLHKLYLLPETQRKGLGKLVLNRIIALAKENNSDRISLNVNRFNNAFEFYLKIGFKILAEENLDIGQGYLMEDYVMEMKL